jgi:hypothetical protein
VSLAALLHEAANERLGVGLQHVVDLVEQVVDLLRVDLGRLGSGRWRRGLVGLVAVAACGPLLLLTGIGTRCSEG